MRSFLGHVGFYRRFIKDFSKISHPLCKLLENECDESCLKAFGELKENLVSDTPIISPNWSEQFEVMSDVSGVALSVVLGRRRDKILHTMYYSSKALNKVQKNYMVIE